MNFYQLYNLINEYGQSLIETLTQKFQQEVPTLTPTIIRNYIDRFDRIKNNLPEKDITKYTWKQLENTVDGYQPKQRIKAGKLDPTVTDANLLYNQDGTRIYLGKNKKSCIRYGNGYSFCISARGENNMYAQYRIRNQGTPYFIFNDKLPKTDNRHLMVLFVYPTANNWIDPEFDDSPAPYRYAVTLATNQPEDETEYQFLEQITNLYPWTKPLENFIDDKTKGNVDVEPFEILEDWLTESFNNKNYKLRWSSKNLEDTHLVELLSDENNFLKNYKKLKNFLSDEKKNLISIGFTRTFKNENNFRSSIYVYKFDEYETLDELKDYLIKTTELMNKTVLEEGGADYKDKKGLEDYIRTSKEIEGVFDSFAIKNFHDFGILKYPEDDDDRLGENKDTFIIKLYAKPYIQQILNKSQVIEPLAALNKEYYSNLNWLNQRTKEETKTMLDEINELYAKADAAYNIRFANTTTVKDLRIFDDAFDSFKKLF
jgi:hypothetical protein